MGGCDFSNTGTGRSASEVFHKLKEEALYGSGHDGYSGTIAEKPGFRIIPQPSQEQLRATVAKQVEYAKNGVKYAEEEVARQTAKKNDPNPAFAQYISEWIEGAKKKLAQAQEHLRTLEAMLASKDSIVPNESLLHDYADWYDEQHPNEKWGDAYCLVLKEPEPIKPIGKAKALSLAKAKWGETAEIVVKTERASKANGNKRRIHAYVNAVTKEAGWGMNERVPGGYKHTVKSAEAADEKEALGMLFAEDGKFLFFGCASS